MSVKAASLSGPGPLSAESPQRRTGFALGAWPLPWPAFVVSRVLVLLAGLAGALLLEPHVSSVTTTLLHRQLGPVGYALAGSVDRFDSGIYLGIAAHGYGSFASGKVAFFPLYPLLIHGLTPIFGSDVLAGVAISLASFAGALLLLQRLTEYELGRPAADATILLVTFAPLSFFFSAVYTESLFLLLSVGAALAVRRQHWALACGLGVLATLTRPTGMLLMVLLAGLRIGATHRLDRRLLGVLALPAAFVGFMVVLAGLGYPWLAPFRAEAIWQRELVGPILGLASAGWQAVRGVGQIAAGAAIYHPTLTGPFSPSAENIVLWVNLLVAGLALVWCWRRLAWGYTAYASVVLLSMVSNPVVGDPLISFDRYLLTVFPLFMVAGEWVTRRRLVTPVVLGATVLLVFYTVQFSSWSFVA